MKIETTKLQGRFRVFWYDYPKQAGPFGSGGWSRNARHRPKPVLVVREVRDITLAGKAVMLPDGTRKLKCVIVRCATNEVLRDDYGVDRIKQDLFTSTVGEVELEAPAAPAAPFGETGRKLITETE